MKYKLINSVSKIETIWKEKKQKQFGMNNINIECEEERENKLFPPYKIEGYFFTSEQLNKYTANVIKQALEAAAEKAKLVDVEIPYTGVRAGGSYFVKDIDKQSITNTFEESYNKLKV